jgi:hypothetical protein
MMRHNVQFIRSAISAIIGAVHPHIGDVRSQRSQRLRRCASVSRKDPMHRHAKRSAAADAVFFTALENGHAVRIACRAAGYARRCVYRWRGQDAAFAAAWAHALQMAGDLLEEEADRRGRDGIDVPIFHEGEACGTKRKYADTLLLARLKAIRPETYRDRVLPAKPDTRPVTVQLRDFALEHLAQRLLRGETVEISEIPPRLQQVLFPPDTASGTQKPPPTPVPLVPVP